MNPHFRSCEDPAAWMRNEYQSLLALNKTLKEHIAAMPDTDIAGWLDGLRAGFERLYTHLDRVFAAQEAGGTLEQLLERRPTLSRQVECLKHEHAELLRMGRAIRRDLAETGPADRLLAADACARVQRFNAVVAQHEQKENMITMFVFNQDLGGGD